MLEKKLFVVASVAALSSLMATAGMAGCSSTDTGPGASPEAGSSSDSSASLADVVQSDVNVVPDGSVGWGPCPDTTPITAADIEMSIAPAVWAPPGPFQSVCTQQNIDDLKALFASSTSGVKFADIPTTLGTACAACAFSMTTDAKWSQFVQDGTKGCIDNTFGACMGQLEGAACGKAAFELDQCLSGACPQDTCTDQVTCVMIVSNTACKDLGAAARAACPSLQADMALCATLFSTIAINCGGGPDAGLDASK